MPKRLRSPLSPPASSAFSRFHLQQQQQHAASTATSTSPGRTTPTADHPHPRAQDDLSPQPPTSRRRSAAPIADPAQQQPTPSKPSHSMNLWSVLRHPSQVSFRKSSASHGKAARSSKDTAKANATTTAAPASAAPALLMPDNTPALEAASPSASPSPASTPSTSDSPPSTAHLRPSTATSSLADECRASTTHHNHHADATRELDADDDTAFDTFSSDYTDHTHSALDSLSTAPSLKTASSVTTLPHSPSCPIAAASSLPPHSRSTSHNGTTKSTSNARTMSPASSHHPSSTSSRPTSAHRAQQHQHQPPFLNGLGDRLASPSGAARVFYGDDEIVAEGVDDLSPDRIHPAGLAPSSSSQQPPSPHIVLLASSRGVPYTGDEGALSPRSAPAMPLFSSASASAAAPVAPPASAFALHSAIASSSASTATVQQKALPPPPGASSSPYPSAHQHRNSGGSEMSISSDRMGGEAHDTQQQPVAVEALLRRASSGTALAQAGAVQTAVNGGCLWTMPNLSAVPLWAFEGIKTLGTGTFGRVLLVRMRQHQQQEQSRDVRQPSPRYYALKILRKADIVRLKQVEHINNERDILSHVQHPFIVNLLRSYQDSKSCYMLMDFVPGGEIFSHLRRAKRFSADVTRFYIASIILALDYLHSKGIIYRDLKPENLLLDEAGFLKIADFGFAKHVPDNRTWTLCGTPEYLAPEIISGTGHGKEADYWSLGVLMFECLAGYPPFFAPTPIGVYERVLKGAFSFPAHIDPLSRNLISALLTPDRTKRLGNLRGGAEDVKRHAWFAGVSWSALEAREVRAPIVPRLVGAGDASYFQAYPEEMDARSVPGMRGPEAAGAVDPYAHMFRKF